MRLIIDDQITEPLKEYTESLGPTFNYITAEVSKRLANFTKVNYLMGQKLNRKTGETFQSVKFFKLKNFVMGVKPGVGVRGSLNYLNKWIGTDKEFMAPALKQFEDSRRAEKIMKQIIAKRTAKAGF